jgi:hypothetical protein
VLLAVLTAVDKSVALDGAVVVVAGCSYGRSSSVALIEAFNCAVVWLLAVAVAFGGAAVDEKLPLVDWLLGATVVA